MLATGKLLPDSISEDSTFQESILGLEFSGRLENGKRVMGLVPCKGLATAVAADPDLLWEVPDDWSLVEASTVPMAYSTAYYALIMRGNLKNGERVLIHSGSGAVGQAAIAIAISLGCKIFTTVGSTEKREFLKKRFRELQEKNFCNSRDTSFEEYILNSTNGEGVDVILNSLSEEKFKTTLNCLARHGRFLEIGKYDLSQNTPIGTALFLKNVSFHGILIEALFENESYSFKAKKEVVRLVQDGISNGTVKPLNLILFDPDQAEQAFRFMASGKHIGKVVLKIRNEEPQRIISPTPIEIKALSRTECNPEKSYVIIGGLGGFGLELSQWLVDRGARYLVLTSRSGLKTGYQKLCLERWKKENITVIASKLDATKMAEAKLLLKLAAKLRPVAAIFNLALVLRDAFMENQTIENFKEVCSSKIDSTLNLDVVSRDLCPQLERFVCFSSVTSSRGNAGQSNYGYANSFMERICEERRKEGLPGLAIQWGFIADVGVTQDTMGPDIVIRGIIPQRISSCLIVLDKFLQQNHPVVFSFVPYQPSENNIPKDSKQNILARVGNIFGIKDMSAINPETTLGELGMDSLIGVELQQFFERDFDLLLTIPELRQLTIKDVKKLGGSNQETKTSTFKSKPISNSSSESDTMANEKLPGKFSLLSGKQLVPAENIVHLNSLETGVPLFIVHPIEGTAAIFNSLASLTNFPVYGIQYTAEAPSDSIEELAAWYWKHIKLLNLSGTIFLAGYSFGTAVAFEMCLQAEREPQHHFQIGHLILLDASPALVSAYTREHKSVLGNDSIVEVETSILCSFVLKFLNINVTDLKKELMILPNLTDRIKKSVETISATYNHMQTDDLTEAFDLYYKKILMALKYIPRHNIKKDVTLIKASDSVERAKFLSETYDLEKVCNNKIAVHTVKGTHTTFLLENGAKEVSNVLNGILS